jgi:hypothetical protein
MGQGEIPARRQPVLSTATLEVAVTSSRCWHDPDQTSSSSIGKTLGPACWTGQRRRLSTVPLLMALQMLQVEYLLLQLDVGDACLQHRLLQHLPGTSPMIATPVPARPCLPLDDSVGTRWVRGTLAWAVLELQLSLEVPGNSVATLLFQVSMPHHSWL